MSGRWIDTVGVKFSESLIFDLVTFVKRCQLLRLSNLETASRLRFWTTFHVSMERGLQSTLRFVFVVDIGSNFQTGSSAECMLARAEGYIVHLDKCHPS